MVFSPSENYFKEVEMGLFSGKNLNADVIKNEAPEVFAEIAEMGKEKAIADLSEELQSLKAKNESLQLDVTKFEEKEKEEKEETARVFQIEQAAEAFNLKALGAELISEGKTVAEAMTALIEGKSKVEANSSDSFNDSAASIAGSSSSDDLETEPTNFAQAQKMVQKRDGCSLAEARETAKMEFPKLIAKRG